MLSNGKEDEQPVNALQTSDLGTILDQTMSSCMFLHFPSSVSKLKGKTNKHWVSLKSPKAACKRAIIPEQNLPTENWFLIYHERVIFSQKLLKRESFLSSSLTCFLLLAIQKLPLSFLIPSHYFCIYIWKLSYRFPFTEYITYLWNSWQTPGGVLPRQLCNQLSKSAN